MYARPEIKDYRDKWLEAERELAINGAQVIEWLPSAHSEPTEHIDVPPDAPKPEKARRHNLEDCSLGVSRKDVLLALRRVAKTKVDSPRAKKRGELPAPSSS